MMKTNGSTGVLGLLALGASMVAFNASAAAVPGKGSWEATLHARDLDGNGSTDAYYDSVLDITWLADANYAKSSGYTDHGTGLSAALWNGTMSWDRANAWAEQLVIGGFDDWRLPKFETSSSTNTVNTDNELIHLYYVTLGNTAFGLTNTGPFANVKNQLYWLSNEYSAGIAHSVDFGSGVGVSSGKVGNTNMGGRLWAWAVRDGDVTPVPEPRSIALLLMGLGLAAVAASRGRRSASQS